MKSNTKNAKGSGTIRKRSDGRWEARYTTGIDPKTGKQTQKSVYGKTQKEVRQKLTEVTAEIDSGTYLEQTKDTGRNIRKKICSMNLRKTKMGK